MNAPQMHRLEERLTFSLSFEPPVQSPVGPVAEMATADFNRDGRPDLAVAAGANSTISGVVRILAGDGAGKFFEIARLGAGSSISALAAADFNNDGKTDLAAANNNAAGTVTVLLGNGDGTFGAPKSWFAGANPHDLVIGDFDGNRTPDILAANRERWSLPYSTTPAGYAAGLLLGRGDGTFSPTMRIPLQDGQTHAAAGDVDGDGRIDVVFGGPFSASASPIERALIQVVINRGYGMPRVVAFSPFVGKVAGLAVRDLNSDGRGDLAAVQDFSSSSGGSATLYTFIGAGDGTFSPRSSVSAGINQPAGLSVADLDRDGRLDFVITGADARPTPTGVPPQGAASVLLGTGGGGIAKPALFATGPIPAAQLLADLDQDGLTDIVTGSTSGVSTLLNDSGPVVLQHRGAALQHRSAR